MVDRPMKALILLFPVSPEMLAVQAMFASWFAYMASMNMALRWMIYGIIGHIITTVLCVLFLPDQRGTRHIKKDAAVKGFALLVVWLLGKEPAFQFEIAGQSVSAGALVAGYFLCGEWIGVATDMDDLNMPLPGWVKKGLQMARDRINSVEVGPQLSAIAGKTETVVIKESK